MAHTARLGGIRTMKYLALVAACLLTLGLAPAAVADDGPDPVQVTFPEITRLNPAHTPYVLEIDDPAPERGELVLVWGGSGRIELPHDGSFAVPLASLGTDYPKLYVLRCPADGTCTTIAESQTLYLVTSLDLTLASYRVALGERSRVPLGEFEPELEQGERVRLEWTLTEPGTDQVLVAGRGDHVVGEQAPLLGLQETTAKRGVLDVHAVAESAQWGTLEATTRHYYDLDFAAPAPVRVYPSTDVLFPARDGFRDILRIGVRGLPSGLGDMSIDLVGSDGTARQLFRGAEGYLSVHFGGRYEGEQVPVGRYVIRVTAWDYAGNPSVSRYPLRIDDRRAVERTYRQTIPAARTLADQFVGSCSSLGPALGRGWRGSLGLYSSTCGSQRGETVITVHGARLPRSLPGYEGSIKVTTYGGGARGSSSAYVVHGWLRNSDNDFILRSQFNGRLGDHVSTARPAQVVREGDGTTWVYWQLGLTDGSRYDVKSFTVE